MPQIDYCVNCLKDFTKTHYVWFICLECHKNDPNVDPNESFEYRLQNEVELIDWIIYVIAIIVNEKLKKLVFYTFFKL